MGLMKMGDFSDGAASAMREISQRLHEDRMAQDAAKAAQQLQQQPIPPTPVSVASPVAPAVKSTGSSTSTVVGRVLTAAEASEREYLIAEGNRVAREVSAYLAAKKPKA